MPPSLPLPLFPLLLLLFVLPHATALRFSFEQCTTSQQCAPNYSCNVFDSDTAAFSSICASLVRSEDDDHTCFCQPVTSIRPCSSDSACPSYEVCARTNANDRSPFLCYSCALLTDSLVTPFNPSTSVCATLPTLTPFPSATPQPTVLPMGGAFDLCSFTATTRFQDCDTSMICMDVDFGGECSFAAPHCHCLPIIRTECDTSSACHPDHVCALHTRTHERLCTSCNAVMQRVDLLPIDADCPPIPSQSRQTLQHLPTLNGFTRDRCLTPEMCRDTRRCTSPDVVSPCDSFSNDQCHCRPQDGVRNCTTSAACDAGEVCVSYLTEETPICMSASLTRVTRTLFGLRVYDEDAAKPLPSPPSRKLSGEMCMNDWECAGARRCSHVAERRYGGCAGRRACVCRPWTRTPCEDSAECDMGEACVNYRGALSQAFCWGEDAARRDGLVDGVDDGEAMPTMDEEEMTAEPEKRLVGEMCRWDQDCREGAECRHVSEDVARCEGREGCECENKADDAVCLTDADCVSGEGCMMMKDAIERLRLARCRSRASVESDALGLFESRPSPSPSPSLSQTPPKGPSASPFPRRSDDGDGVCVDAALLAHLPAKERVFRRARRASVLCDESGSCATAGHVVEFGGVFMRMRRYCALDEVTCRRGIRWVNSPKMRRGIRVESRTKGLRFTALAARWNSAMEEVVLRMILRAGF